MSAASYASSGFNECVDGCRLFVCLQRDYQISLRQMIFGTLNLMEHSVRAMRLLLKLYIVVYMREDIRDTYVRIPHQHHTTHQHAFHVVGLSAALVVFIHHVYVHKLLSTRANARANEHKRKPLCVFDHQLFFCPIVVFLYAFIIIHHCFSFIFFR